MDIVTCPTTSQLEALLRGQIQGTAAADLAEHIEGCETCIQIVGVMAVEVKANLPKTILSLPDIVQNIVAEEPARDPLKFLAAAQRPDELGRLAHYRVLKILGEGGMGIVLQAEDTLLERPVALKVIKPEYSRDNIVRQRFMREARLMAAVKSDHVVTIHQVGQVADNCFIAMELLEGESLDFLKARVNRPPLSETIRIAREVAQALDAAHAKGLTHRDIKPENIWLESPTGRVKLLDFGLARPQTVNVRLTTSGMIMGTPAYMAPEQSRAEAVDERTDLFSLGCILYELICGVLPYRGDTVWEILYALNETEPDAVSVHWPGVSNDLNDLVMQLLKKDPAERPQSAAELIERLLTLEGSLSEQDSLFSVKTITSSTHMLNPKNRSNAGIARDKLHQTSLPSARMSQMIQRDAERRQVTVLVCNCDLFESEEFFEQLDSEEQANVMRNFQNACAQAIQNLDGTVVYCNDDGLLACFGFPTAYEDAAIRAAGVALTVLELLTLLGDEIRHKHGLELGASLGVHTGPAIVKAKADGVSFVGEARNIALQLKDISAASGRVVCTQFTHQLLRGRFDCMSLGQQKFKGLSDPVELFEVRAEIEDTTTVECSEPVQLSPLTGRDLEINLLKDRWEQAKDGVGQIVTLIGEAGLGKSRLVHGMKQFVCQDISGSSPNTSPYASDGMIVGMHSPIVEWRCSPHFQNSGLYPAVNFFERLLHFGRDTSPSAGLNLLVKHLETHKLALPDVVPLLASLLSLPSDEKFPSLELSPVRERQELFRILKEWLRAYSEEQPILFIVEDLHWLDASTLEFLGQFLSEVSNDKILTLLTFRPEFHYPWPSMQNHTSLGLNRLTKRQAGDLMRKKIGGDLPEAVIDQIYDRAGGVPLFIEEFTKMLQESGVLERGKGSKFKTMITREIPTTLQDLLMARLDSMEGDREVAQLASTIGREFSFELLSAASGLDDAELCANLSKLVKAEILYEKGRAPKSTYIFKHALLEDALYNAMVKSKRQQFHARLAEILETRFPQIGAAQPELLAHHFVEGGLNERSLNYWLSAGLRSQEQFANFEAINHFKRGLELLALCDDCPERDEIELMMLIPLGSVYQAIFGYAAPEVGPAFARARELCQKVGETSQLFSIMWGNWSWHLVRGELRLAMSLANDMVTFARNVSDIGILMEAYVAPAVTSFYLGNFAGCRKWCEDAIAEHENQEHCRIWSTMTGQNSALHVRTYLTVALFHLGYPEQALRCNDETIEMARKIAHPFSLAHALHFTGWLLVNCRMGERLHAAGVEETKIASEHGFALWESTGTFFTGAGLFLQGELNESIRLMEKGIQSFRAVAAILTLPGQLCILAEAYIKAGRLSDARAALNEGLELAKGNSDRSKLADLQRLDGELVMLESGDRVTAEKCFHDAIETACNQQSRGMALRGTTSLARLWYQQGRHDEAKAALATVYGVYDEGFETEDLVKAKELLNLLGP